MNKRKLQSQKMGKDKTAYDYVLGELEVMKQIEHPNIIWLHEIINDPKKDNLFLVTEYHSKGSLGDILKRSKNGLNTNKARLYMIDILRALHYCHNTLKVIHRDIKPDNIVINHNEEAVLIDFGVSVLMDSTSNALKNVTGTMMYYAPEMFPSAGNSQIMRGEQTDMWSMGVTFYMVLTGKYPFKNI